MFPILWRTIKNKRIAITAFAVSAVGFALMYVALFPSIQKSSEQLIQAMEAYPESMMKAFGVDSVQTMLSSLEGFIATEFFSFIWPIMAVILACSLPGTAIAGEIEKGTIEIVLSQPVSRAKIFFGKYLAGVFGMLIFSVIPIISIVPIAAFFGIDYNLNSYFVASFLSFIFGLAVLSIASFFASIFSDKGKVYFLTGGILILMYVLNIVANLKDNLKDLHYASFFYYYNATGALVHTQIDKLAYPVFLGTALLFTLLGLFWFTKRDIAV
ncbi:TPA: hypothetical protein DDW69_02400 [candidate division CPR2 bacterium]|uniref:ABC transporter permease n=1 Tax=candidate division CPR2 bacterium GW2011_GWC1_41_48 TaxID=1618344 RepID=A0A0G0WCT2_UNCC2|nr:MAG: hypothetical protein UT47_C0001G0282 [candidate division CPR2 bacterium GW2011_GWC2_39_35]KKR29163.1 MAG: hypothetical protein UT60_C0006G0026 [candidate division CPR2 bacterium GW2011_GWD2_39_7]KKS09877.1 MAG: hypothetical protein UU65_C0001G0282 [candidate division CPR2 bacterium GW2011_GWC1_41_48]OGB70653.1 MAG: hypothetical protein A2Y26_01495 [candidate division CPR2 bacterium GWD2_39_7]HBG81671.1 hypothetical protein [candidate division CPR2 bacterium]